jgi:membrane-associated phospholipid phosphatase
MADTLSSHLRPAGKVGVWLLAAGVAASRLHVGAHHATDTMAGLGMGALAAEASNALLDRLLPTVDPIDGAR